MLLVVMGIIAAISGVIGYALARNGVVVLLEPLASRVPPEKHVRFVADPWAHSASNLVGFVGGNVLVVLTWKGRASHRPTGR